ncbi:MAG: hypothetical protein ABIS86_01530 [Streptosporangiaceae bacterium]
MAEPRDHALLGLTVVTGLVESFSSLLLGHVFVANRTGNASPALSQAVSEQSPHRPPFGSR